MSKTRLTKLQQATLSAMLKRERHADDTLEYDNATAIGGLSEHEKMLRRCTMSCSSSCSYFCHKSARYVSSSPRTFGCLERRGLIQHKGSGWFMLTDVGRAEAEAFQ